MVDGAVEDRTNLTPPPQVTPADRTKVILMSQVVTIVALIVLWLIVRSRRAGVLPNE